MLRCVHFCGSPMSPFFLGARWRHGKPELRCCRRKVREHSKLGRCTKNGRCDRPGDVDPFVI